MIIFDILLDKFEPIQFTISRSYFYFVIYLAISPAIYIKLREKIGLDYIFNTVLILLFET